MWINTELYSPVINEGIPPYNSVYYESFWLENRNYILNGYDVGGKHITGDHYWYLNFWPIRGLNRKTGRKGIINPRFLDIDADYYTNLDVARAQGKNMCVVKARQKGFTEKHAAMGGREYSFFPASQVVYVAGQEFYTTQLMNATKRGLNDLVNTEYYKRRSPDRQDYMMASYKEIIELADGTKQEKVKGYLSEIYAITAMNNPQAVSSKSPSLIVFEEAGIFQGLIPTFRFVEPSLLSEGQQTGMAIIVGTGGEMKYAKDFEKIFFNPEAFNMLSFDLSEYDDEIESGKKQVGYFVPANKYRIIDQFGNSLIKESTEDVMKAREAKKGADQYTEIVNNPLKPTESFLIETGGFFGKEIAAVLNQRRSYINTHKEAQTGIYGNIFWLIQYPNEQEPRMVEYVNGLKGGFKIVGAQWVPGGIEQDDDNPYFIMEHPEMDGPVPDPNLYISAVDSYDKDKSHTSESRGSGSVFKKFRKQSSSSRKFVARLFDRPEKSEMFFERTAKLNFYYNVRARCLIEWSNILIFKWYEKMGFEYMLAERPELVIANWITNSTVNNRYGIDPSTKRHWLTLLKDYLSDVNNVGKLEDIEQISAYLFFKYDPKYNCDITISSSLCLVMDLEEEESMMDNQKSEEDEGPAFGYKLDSSGQLVQTFNN